MKTFIPFGMIAATAVIVGGMTTQALANPMSAVCEIRAERISGYSGDRRGLTWSLGQFDFRLSGSVAFGLRHTSGSSTSTVSGATRGFAGVDAQEQRDARKMRQYAKIYQSCMQGG